MSEWYYIVADEPQGPIAEPDLREMFKTGQLPPTTFIFREGMSEWIHASKTKEFSSKRNRWLTVTLLTTAAAIGAVLVAVSVNHFRKRSVATASLEKLAFSFNKTKHMLERAGFKVAEAPAKEAGVTHLAKNARGNVMVSLGIQGDSLVTVGIVGQHEISAQAMAEWEPQGPNVAIVDAASACIGIYVTEEEWKEITAWHLATPKTTTATTQTNVSRNRKLRNYEFTSSWNVLQRDGRTVLIEGMGLARNGEAKIYAGPEQRIEETDAFVEGLARARVGVQWGYVDSKGTFVIEPRFIYAGRFKDGYSKVMTEGGWGFITKTGKVTSSEIKYDDAGRPEASEKTAQLTVAARLSGDDGYLKVPEWQAWIMMHKFFEKLPPED